MPFDFSKASYKVSHDIVINKIMNQAIVTWIQSRLNNYTKPLCNNDFASSYRKVLSGMTKESVLGPGLSEYP